MGNEKKKNRKNALLTSNFVFLIMACRTTCGRPGLLAVGSIVTFFVGYERSKLKQKAQEQEMLAKIADRDKQIEDLKRRNDILEGKVPAPSLMAKSIEKHKGLLQGESNNEPKAAKPKGELTAMEMFWPFDNVEEPSK